jgi:hypothetical protein
MKILSVVSGLFTDLLNNIKGFLSRPVKATKEKQVKTAVKKAKVGRKPGKKNKGK